METNENMEPFPEVCQDFANVVIDRPFMFNNYGKMGSKQGCLLEQDLQEERIEDILKRM